MAGWGHPVDRDLDSAFEQHVRGGRGFAAEYGAVNLDLCRCGAVERGKRITLEMMPSGPIGPKLLSDIVGLVQTVVEQLGLTFEAVAAIDPEAEPYAQGLVSVMGRDVRFEDFSDLAPDLDPKVLLLAAVVSDGEEVRDLVARARALRYKVTDLVVVINWHELVDELLADLGVNVHSLFIA